MKRIAIIAIVVFFTASPLFAAAITDATKPLGHFKLSVSAEDNFIFDKDIETTSDRSKFDLEDVNQVYAKAAVGLTPYFNIYGKLGAANGGDIDTVNRDSRLPLKVETEYGLLWGVGISGAKEIMDGLNLGVDTQFNYNKVDVDKVTYRSRSTTGVDGEIEYFDAQITPFISKKFSFDQWSISPYVGCVVNFFWTQTDSPLKYTESGFAYSENWNLKSDDNVGIVVGSDLQVNERFAVVVEGRFIEETAIAGGATYRF